MLLQRSKTLKLTIMAQLSSASASDSLLIYSLRAQNTNTHTHARAHTISKSCKKANVIVYFLNAELKVIKLNEGDNS